MLNTPSRSIESDEYGTKRSDGCVGRNQSISNKETGRRIQIQK